MSELIELQERVERPLLIAVADLTRFTALARRTVDVELAEFVNTFYERVTVTIEAAGGTIVKFMGDAALIVFPAERVDAGVDALLSLKEEVDRYWGDLGWQSRLVVKAHFGTVVAGPFGLDDQARFDVLGSAVNQTVTMESSAFAVSAAAFRKLSPTMRKHFKKHTPPITYIRTEDSRH